ncbi:major facilitator superfamily domain-containing protein [Jimgerdemannia flammicorona]|uniref:Major facilitator superfamily domain-containing protein n=1 Tax=Jimgerdemannia flammicorona TaxID=994334 RepID=A0A433DIB2_9FUNG|nr:major facilitator superfamily domain-containing protein [Jimgerdemannia flammicorona]
MPELSKSGDDTSSPKDYDIEETNGPHIALITLGGVAMDDAPESKYLEGKKLVGVLMGLGLTLFMTSLDVTIVATALPKIGSELYALDKASWVVTAYILTYNVRSKLFIYLLVQVDEYDLFQILTIQFFIFRVPISSQANCSHSFEGLSATHPLSQYSPSFSFSTVLQQNFRHFWPQNRDYAGNCNIYDWQRSLRHGFINGTAYPVPVRDFPILIALQGLGAAGMNRLNVIAETTTPLGAYSLIMIIASEIVPIEKRGVYSGILNVAYILSSICGPLIGGVIADRISWRWCFFINLPVGVMALLLIWFLLPYPMPTGSLWAKFKRVDYLAIYLVYPSLPGTIFIVSGTTVFLFALETGGTQYPWNSAPVISCLVAGLVLYIALVLVEWKVAVEPLIPLRLFKLRTVAAVFIGNWFFGNLFYAILVNLPYYFQMVNGDSAITSGIKVIPIEIGVAVFAFVAGLIVARTKTYYIIYIIGAALVILGTVLVSTFTEQLSLGIELAYMTLLAVGMGFTLTASFVASQSAAEPSDLAVVTGLVSFMRILGGAIGLAIASTALQGHLSDVLPGILPAEQVEPTKRSAVYLREKVAPELQPLVVRAYVEGFTTVHRIMVVFAALAFLAVLFVQNHSLSREKEEVVGDAVTQEKRLEEDVVVLAESKNMTSD